MFPFAWILCFVSHGVYSLRGRVYRSMCASVQRLVSACARVCVRVGPQSDRLCANLPHTPDAPLPDYRQGEGRASVCVCAGARACVERAAGWVAGGAACP